VTATTTDAAGNVSPEATPVSFTVDTVGPAAPVIISPADGSSTNDTTPPIAGTAEPDSTVEVFVDGTSIGTTTADADGNWSVTPATPLAEGAHTATATATDAGGTVSPESAAVAFTVDLTPPAAPAVVTPADGSLTNDTTPPISGTAEPGATVNVRIDGAVVGTTLADGSGAWTFTPATALAEGAHTVSATATDAAGNTGPISNTNTFTVDSVAPAAPVVTAPADGSSTADATPTITGTAEPNTTVTVTIDGAELGTAPVDALGNWTLTPATPLGDGEHTVTATATDAAGNESGPSAPVSFTVDTTGPAAPVITSPADGSTTNDDTPPITGTAEPGSIVTIVIDGTEVGAAETDESGDWTFQPTTPLTEGDHTVTATATDDAGNTGPAASVDFTVDTTPPAAPVITSPADGSATDDSTPPITGTAEPGSEVTVIVDGEPVGTTTADEDGNWTFTPATPLTDGEHVITATATDAAGNAGPASTPLTLRIGSGATAAPGVLPVTGGGSPLIAAFAGALMVALGAGLIGSRRRRA
jgi:LPXTG-motif cell wall-anchored protein